MKMPFVMTHTVVIHVFVIKDILVVVHPGIVLMKMNAPWEDMIAIPRRIVPILMVVGNVPVSIHSLEMERFAKFQSWVKISIFKGSILSKYSYGDSFKDFCYQFESNIKLDCGPHAFCVRRNS